MPKVIVFGSMNMDLSIDAQRVTGDIIVEVEAQTL